MKHITAVILVAVCVAGAFCAKQKGQIKQDNKIAVVEPSKPVVKASFIELRFVNRSDEAEKNYAVRETNEFLSLEPVVLFTEADVKSAELIVDGYGNPSINVTLKDLAAQKYARITTDNIGRRIGIVVNGELLTAPQIREVVSTGLIVIKGSLTMVEAETITRSLSR